MRRIIERVVTVVTTTTWKISWEADTPHTQPEADSAQEIVSNANILLITPTVTETKEADSERAEKSTESNPPAHEVHFYQSNSERK